MGPRYGRFETRYGRVFRFPKANGKPGPQPAPRRFCCSAAVAALAKFMITLKLWFITALVPCEPSNYNPCRLIDRCQAYTTWVRSVNRSSAYSLSLPKTGKWRSLLSLQDRFWSSGSLVLGTWPKKSGSMAHTTPDRPDGGPWISARAGGRPGLFTCWPRG